MEIVYDESGTRVLLRKDDGTEVDLLKLEGALVLAQKSREFNRGRVVELEDKLHRIGAILAEGKASGTDEFLSVPEIEERLVAGERLYTAAEVGDLQASEAELVAGPLRRQVAELEAKVRAYDEDRHSERDRADKATEAANQALNERNAARRRVAELERQLANSVGRENKLEADAAEEKTLHKRSLDARDSLLRAATTKVQAAKEILGATAVGRARDEIVTSKGAVLADAIGNALRVLEV
jgi:chromosome segregation ATPase